MLIWNPQPRKLAEVIIPLCLGGTWFKTQWGHQLVQVFCGIPQPHETHVKIVPRIRIWLLLHIFLFINQ
jgi:hypothetical protein